MNGKDITHPHTLKFKPLEAMMASTQGTCYFCLFALKYIGIECIGLLKMKMKDTISKLISIKLYLLLILFP